MELDRAKGVLLGLACGDALGRPVEFDSPEEITSKHGRLTEMVGQGTWGQPAGSITDDTEQALCIARSLVERGGFDPADVAERFVAWYDSNPFDIGGMTRRSLQKLKEGVSWEEAGQQAWENSPKRRDAGNGSVMRCAPLAIVFATDYDRLERVSRQSSKITHADPRCTGGCALLNLTIAGFLTNQSTPLYDALDRIEGDVPPELLGAIRPLREKDPSVTIEPSGYVINTLQTSLYDALRADSTEDAIVTSVNRGEDADTIGAVTGAVAGARFGASELPDRWLNQIDDTEEIISLADQLHQFN